MSDKNSYSVTIREDNKGQYSVDFPLNQLKKDMEKEKFDPKKDFDIKKELVKETDKFVFDNIKDFNKNINDNLNSKENYYVPKSFVFNYWSTTQGMNFQKKLNFLFDRESFKKSFYKMIKGDKYNIKYGNYKINPKKEERIGVISIYDFHIDQLSEGVNGKVSSFFDELCEIFLLNFKECCTKALINGATEIVFPIGNDFFNTNELNKTTHKGTEVDTDINFKHNYIKGAQLLRECIRHAARKFKKIYVPVVPGNHDRSKMHFIEPLLQVYFETSKKVILISEDSTQNYAILNFGKTGFFFHHGDKLKITTDANANKTGSIILTLFKNKNIDYNRIFSYSGHYHTLRNFYTGFSHIEFQQVPTSNPRGSLYDKDNFYGIGNNGAQILLHVYNNEGDRLSENRLFIRRK